MMHMAVAVRNVIMGEGRLGMSGSVVLMGERGGEGAGRVVGRRQGFGGVARSGDRDEGVMGFGRGVTVAHSTRSV